MCTSRSSRCSPAGTAKASRPKSRGDQIALSIRLFHVADIVEVHYHHHGIDAALEIARERRGAQFDPDIVDEFCRHAHDLLSTTDEETDWMALIDAEPGLRTRLSEPEIDNALEAVADFTDLAVAVLRRALPRRCRSRGRRGHARSGSPKRTSR